MTEAHEQPIQVHIVYPSAHQPAERRFPPSALMKEVKQFALDFFGLHEGTENGNQIVFFLYYEGKRIEDLTQTLGAVVGHHHQAKFRLAKEVIAG